MQQGKIKQRMMALADRIDDQRAWGAVVHRSRQCAHWLSDLRIPLKQWVHVLSDNRDSRRRLSIGYRLSVVFPGRVPG